MLRSRVSAILLLSIPVVLSLAACLIPAARPHWAPIMGLSVASGWIIIYVRSISDDRSGFADGVESSPAAGSPVYASRLIIGLLVTVIQTAIFCGVLRALHFHR